MISFGISVGIRIGIGIGIGITLLSWSVVLANQPWKNGPFIDINCSNDNYVMIMILKSMNNNYYTWGFNSEASQLWHVLRKNNSNGGMIFTLLLSLLLLLLLPLVLVLVLGYDDIKLLFKADDNDDNFDLIDVIILLLMLFNDNMNIDNINGNDDDKNISIHILGFILYCLLIIRIG